MTAIDATLERQCQTCDGAGELTVARQSEIGPFGHAIVYGAEDCGACRGQGWIAVGAVHATQGAQI